LRRTTHQSDTCRHYYFSRTHRFWHTRTLVIPRTAVDGHSYRSFRTTPGGSGDDPFRFGHLIPHRPPDAARRIPPAGRLSSSDRHLHASSPASSKGAKPRLFCYHVLRERYRRCLDSKLSEAHDTRTEH